jgi:hypothetical protein
MTRRHRRFVCSRCGKVNPDYLSFGVGHPTRADYCLNHIPRWVRFKMWIRDMLSPV